MEQLISWNCFKILKIDCRILEKLEAFCFEKIMSDWPSLLFLQFGAIGRPIFLETKDFKKHYHGDINRLKKQLTKTQLIRQIIFQASES